MGENHILIIRLDEDEHLNFLMLSVLAALSEKIEMENPENSILSDENYITVKGSKSDIAFIKAQMDVLALECHVLPSMPNCSAYNCAINK